MKTAPLTGVKLEGVFMRLQIGGTAEFGVVLRSLDQGDRDRIHKYLETIGGIPEEPVV